MPDRFDTDALKAHLQTLQQQWETALAETGFDAAVVPAGATAMYFQDDQAPVFHPNPHFARFFPSEQCERSALLVQEGQRPKLYFHRPDSYWHAPPELPDWAEGAFAVELHGDEEALMRSLVRDLARHARIALIGPAESYDLNLPLAAINPERMTHRLHFARAAKTPFEAARMREATLIGARGHTAARDAFLAGGSEFDIHMAYLAASAQEESKLPYPNIIGIGEHAGLLHYQHYERVRPDDARSLLIDAGGRSGGYHSDITRTYSAVPGDDFDALVAALDERQQRLAASLAAGVESVDLHTRMHHEIAELLVDFDFLRCTPESAFEQRVTDAFFPHGLGHLLGLQTHDVGGHLLNEEGDAALPPERFPTLRYTRQLAEGHVLTVEPGIYFIPALLDALADSPAGDDVNWSKLDRFRPCGGIRIEDNVLVTADGAENMTRAAFRELEAAAQ